MSGELHIILGQMKPEHGQDEGMLACCEDILVAVKQNDPHALASAMKACFDYLEAQPHAEADEGE